jgi:hypothetical protein
MSGRLPRFTPYGDMWASGNEEILVNDQPIGSLPGDAKPFGIAPVWVGASPIDLSKNRILYTYNRSGHGLDGRLVTASWPDWTPRLLDEWVGGDLLSAGGGRFTVERGTDLFFDDGTPWRGFVNPCWDDDGVLFACTMAPPVDVLHSGPTSAMQIVRRAWEKGRDPDPKPANGLVDVVGAQELSLRAGALAWQDGRRIYGRVSPTAPVEDLTLSGVDGEGRPIFVDTPAGKWLVSHVTRGPSSRAIGRPKGSTRGVVLFDGDTDGPHDARYYAPTKSIRYRGSVRGVPIVREIPLDSPLVEVLPPIVIEPPHPPPPPTGPKRWAFAPDGTRMTNARRFLFHPFNGTLKEPGSGSDRYTVCCHKNSEADRSAEWRRVILPRIFHLCDRSRTPSDKGWYVTPLDAAVWCLDEFVSGQVVVSKPGRRVEVDGSEGSFWQQRVTLYVLDDEDGICVQFDPRPFPNLFGQKWVYERHFYRGDGGGRYETWFTPGPGEADERIWFFDMEPGTAPTTRPYLQPPGFAADDTITPDLPKPPTPPTPGTGEPPMFTVPDEEIIAFKARVLARADAIGVGLEDLPPNLSSDLSALADLGVKYREARTKPGIRDHEIATRKVEALMHQWRRDGWLGGGDPGPLPDYPPLPGDPSGGGGQPPVTPGAIAGRLRVERGRLRDDAGFVNYQAVSEFTLPWHALQGNWGEVDRRQSRAAAARRNAQRLLCMLDWFDPTVGPVRQYSPDTAGWDAAMDGVIERAAAQALRSQLTIFADAQRLYPDHQERRRVMRKVLTRYRSAAAVWFRLANEARKNGWREGDDPKILELADEAADILGHRDFAISDYLDGDDEGGTAAQVEAYRRIGQRSNILVLHPSRKEDGARVRWVEHLKGFREIVDKVAPQCAGIHDEPMGAAGAREPGRRDSRAAAHMAAACTAACLGLGFTYHYISDRDDATPGLAESAAALLVQTSPDYRFTNANLGGSWVTTFSGAEKVRPCHNGTRGFAAGIGFRRGTLNTAAGWGAKELASVERDGLVGTLWEGAR